MAQLITLTRRLILALTILLPFALLPLASADSNVHETTLPNGLKILTKEIHATPIVSLWTYYRVGARNERPGITGISHLIEHMMFKGTTTLKPGDIDRLTALAGGKNNAFTDSDYTAYYFAMPSDTAMPAGQSGLETVLKIEADRMLNCVMDPKELEHETQVVLSELEGDENNPLNRLDENTKAAAFKVHPYHWPTIGWTCDVKSITRSDVLAYYRTYYMPNNAVLVLVGDFDTQLVVEKIRQLFGPLPKGTPPPKVAGVEPEQEGERRVILKGESSAIYFETLYHIPATTHPDMPALGVLDSLLTVGQSSRLIKALVNTGIATGVSSDFSQQLDPGWETVFATCAENVDRQKFEHAFDAVVTDLQERLISPAELAKAKRQTITQTIFSMDGVSDQGSLLGSYEVVANWPYLLTLTLDIDRVTAQQVRAVARKYLTADNRTVSWFIPEKINKDIPAAIHTKPGTIHRRFSRCARSADKPVLALSPVAAATFVSKAIRKELPNGMVLLLQENHANPTVAISGNVDAGAMLDPEKRPGLSFFVAEMLSRGTTSRSSLKFHEELDTLGAELNFGGSMDASSISGKCLSQDLPKLLELVHDALCHPEFPSSELTRLRAEEITAFKEDECNPFQAAMTDLRLLLYPEGHPERHRIRGSEESIKAIRRSDLVNFYRKYYRPDTTTLSIVGDFNADQLASRLQSLFGTWKATGPRPKADIRPIPEVSRTIAEKPIRIPISDKAEAIVIMGAGGVSIHSPDYFAALTANHILGGGELLNSRLLTSLREKQGLTYSVSSDFHSSRGERPWILTMQNNPKNVGAAIRGVTEELTRIRSTPPTEDELAQAHATLVGSLLLSMETNSAIAENLSTLELYGLEPNWIRFAVEQIRKVTPDDVLAAARKYLPAPDRVITVIAGSDK